MKKNLNLLSYLMIASLLIFSACKKKTEPSAEENQINQLSATWNLDAILPSGFDALTLSGVSITFNADKTYSISGIAVLDENNLNNDASFAASGSFALSGSNLELLTLTPGGSFTIKSVNQETGAISLSYTAKYPKSTSSDVEITVNGTLAN